MFSICPRDTEKFYDYYGFIFQEQGIKNWETVEGEIMLTFKDVCIQLRLLENDHELENTLERASAFRTFNKIYG